MTYFDILAQYDWEQTTQSIVAQTTDNVAKVIKNGVQSVEDFKALVSPAAEPFLEEMARESHRVTRQRFGKVIQLYVPIYLSNFCENRCVYCGFNAGNHITRKVLSIDEIKQELLAIKANPFDHLLIVTGEAPKKSGIAFLAEAVKEAKKHFHQVSIEVQPLETNEYKQLKDIGLHGVFVYQETYNAKTYPTYHPAGRKADFRFRLETPERIGEAGIHKIGLGSLIGLEEWRTEAYFTALHIDYLKRKFWQSKFSVSFPRLRPYAGQGFQPNHVATERHLVQLIGAYRLFDKDLELSLSTRESAHFRDNAFPLGITAMSAGSKTGPGGYTGSQALEQFAVHDDRSPLEVADAIKNRGFEPVWKDWDSCLQG
jgi:2-iminoacetate synthase